MTSAATRALRSVLASVTESNWSLSDHSSSESLPLSEKPPSSSETYALRDRPRVESVSDSASDWASAPTLGEGSRVRERRRWKGDMLRERKTEVESSWPGREALEEEWARWPLSPLAFDCERPRPSSALLREREKDERPPIIEPNDLRPNEPDVRAAAAATSGVGLALVGSDLDGVRSRPLESVCCFVSTFEEDHLENRGVVGREEVGEEFSEMELERDAGVCMGCWDADTEEGRLATEEEREWVA